MHPDYSPLLGERPSDGFRAVWGWHYYCNECSFNTDEIPKVTAHHEVAFGHNMYSVFKDKTFE